MDTIAVGDGFKVAVLIPCHNQAATIGAAVLGFAEALPGAQVYVFDNNSTDDTAREATRAGARVRREARDGKASVVRRMFADIEADIYVLAAGDGSYDPADAPSLVNALITERADMVVGRRNAVGSHRTSTAKRLLDRLYRRSVGAAFSDVSLRLPRLHPSLREELPGHLHRLRNRGRDERPRQPADGPRRGDRSQRVAAGA